VSNGTDGAFCFAALVIPISFPQCPANRATTFRWRISEGDWPMARSSLIPVERIERLILVIRDRKVMLDADLAELYGVLTRDLLRAVKRNRDRFPEDFMFQLTKDEFENLRC
jgi:hypothetical protein